MAKTGEEEKRRKKEEKEKCLLIKRLPKFQCIQFCVSFVVSSSVVLILVLVELGCGGDVDIVDVSVVLRGRSAG